MPKKKILVIDDEKNLCFLLKSNLENIGEYVVDVAYSGEEGLTKAKETEYDLVITDFRMPGLNGRDVLNTLKDMRPNSPVVLCSVYHDDISTITALDIAKADGLITKPFDSKQLHNTIKEILADSHRMSKAKIKKEARDGKK
ncbi:MAG: response regulator [Candidatus Omnitrophica bacterium]|nr:response regulator [Candidatus Omnitrophota bacterium]MBU1923503.1 response regulator [Candidatus Omnitrophota bacterium]